MNNVAVRRFAVESELFRKIDPSRAMFYALRDQSRTRSKDCLTVSGWSLTGMHMCDRCGETYDSTELNVNEKLVLDDSGQWKKETTYRCYACIKQDAFG